MSSPVIHEMEQITDGISQLGKKLKETSRQLDLFADRILEVMQHQLDLWIFIQEHREKVKSHLELTGKQLTKLRDSELVVAQLDFLDTDKRKQREESIIQERIQLEERSTQLEDSYFWLQSSEQQLIRIFQTLAALVTGFKEVDDKTVRRKIEEMIKTTLLMGGKVAVGTLFGPQFSRIIPTGKL